MISWYRLCMSMWVLSSDLEETLRVFQRVDQRIDFRRRRVEVERGSRRRLDAEASVRRLRAVMAGPDRDAERVEHLAHVVRVHAVELEADRAAAVDRLGGPEDRESADLLQTLQRVRRDGLLVRGDRLHA